MTIEEKFRLKILGDIIKEANELMQMIEVNGLINTGNLVIDETLDNFKFHSAKAYFEITKYFSAGNQ